MRLGIATLTVNRWSPRIDGLFNDGTPCFAKTITSPGWVPGGIRRSLVPSTVRTCSWMKLNGMVTQNSRTISKTYFHIWNKHLTTISLLSTIHVSWKVTKLVYVWANQFGQTLYHWKRNQHCVKPQTHWFNKYCVKAGRKGSHKHLKLKVADCISIGIKEPSYFAYKEYQALHISVLQYQVKWASSRHLSCSMGKNSCSLNKVLINDWN